VIENVWQPEEDGACDLEQGEDATGATRNEDDLSDRDNEISNVIDDMTKNVKVARTNSAPTEIKTSTSTVAAAKPSHASKTVIPFKYFIIIIVIMFKNS
jgi:hypothetical protein